jgi:hypothetical protein
LTTVCGMETVSSTGPLVLKFDYYGEGVGTYKDVNYTLSDVFESSNQKCGFESIVLAKSVKGEELDSTLVTLEGDFLVVNVSQGVPGETHEFFIIVTTTGEASIAENLTISFNKCNWG